VGEEAWGEHFPLPRRTLECEHLQFSGLRDSDHLHSDHLHVSWATCAGSQYY